MNRPTSGPRRNPGDGEGAVRVDSARSEHAAPITHTVVGDQGEIIPAESLESLEQLDDAVFGALSGDANALDDAPDRLRDALQAVDRQLLNSALHRYRQKASEAFSESNRPHRSDLPKGLAALEILDLLSDES